MNERDLGQLAGFPAVAWRDWRNEAASALAAIDTEKALTTHQEVQAVLQSVAPSIAEWARKEALKEAEDMFRTVDDHFHTHEAAFAVHVLAHGKNWFDWREAAPVEAHDAADAWIDSGDEPRG